MRFSTVFVAAAIAAAAASPAYAAPIEEARDVDTSGAFSLNDIVKTVGGFLSNLKREEVEALLARADDSSSSDDSGAFSLSEFLSGIHFKRDNANTDDSGAFSLSKFLAGIEFKREDLEDLVAREPFGFQRFPATQLNRFGGRDAVDASGAFSISNALKEVGSFLGLKRHEVDAILAREYNDLLARGPRRGGKGGRKGGRGGRGGRGGQGGRGGRKGGRGFRGPARFRRPGGKGGFRKGKKLGGPAGAAGAVKAPPAQAAAAGAVKAPAAPPVSQRSLNELD